jgi:hypothetical protein
MPVKIARSTPRPSFGLPELLVAIHTSRLASRDAAKSLLSTLVSDSSGECRMKTFYIATLTLAMVTAASAQQSTTFRDASGRAIGTTTDSNGMKTFRDSMGRTTGTATIDSNGTTTFRDSMGRITGTASTPRR